MTCVLVQKLLFMQAAISLRSVLSNSSLLTHVAPRPDTPDPTTAIFIQGNDDKYPERGRTPGIVSTCPAFLRTSREAYGCYLRRLSY